MKKYFIILLSLLALFEIRGDTKADSTFSESERADFSVEESPPPSFFNKSNLIYEEELFFYSDENTTGEQATTQELFETNLLPKAQLAQNIQQEILEPCYNGALQKEPGPPEQKTADMLGCLVSRMEHSANKKEENFLLSPEFKISVVATDKNYRGHLEFDAIVPLSWEPEKAVFSQPGFVLLITETQAVIDANLGLVYRFTYHKGVLGLNIFYDRKQFLKQNPRYHDRLGLGVDYQSGKNMFSGNYYYPLRGWINIDEFYEERALGGFEFLFKKIVDKRLELGLGISKWDYKTGSDRAVASVFADYKVDCQSSLGFNMAKDLETDDIKAALNYKIKLYLPEHLKGKDCLQKQYRAEKRELLYRRVQREKAIRLESRRRVPRLFIPRQKARVKEFFSLRLLKSHFSGLKPGEKPYITIDSIPDWLIYNKEAMSFLAVPLKKGLYKVKGFIALTPHSPFSAWQFDIEVQEELKASQIEQNEALNNSAPLLFAEDQRLRQGDILKYAPVISRLKLGEKFTVQIIPSPSDAPGLAWDKNKFIISASHAKIGVYGLSGFITGESGQSNPWFFKVAVLAKTAQISDRGLANSSTMDNSAPLLEAQDQTIKQGMRLSHSPRISQLKLGEKFTVAVDASHSHAPAVEWDSTGHLFHISAIGAGLGIWTVTGSIQDEDNNFSNWSFKVTVKARSVSSEEQTSEEQIPEEQIPEEQTPEEQTPEEQTPEEQTPLNYPAPILTASNQQIQQGHILKYAPVISRLREGESWSVRLEPLPQDAPAVTWDHSNRQFIINAEAAELGSYTINGSLHGQNNRWTRWSFIVKVVPKEMTAVLSRVVRESPEDNEAPGLSAEDQTVRQGASLNYAPLIHRLRLGESFNVRVQNVPSRGPRVRWDTSEKQFMIDAGTADIGDYEITGSIADDSGNDSTWSFKVSVVLAPIVIDPPPAPRVIVENPIVVDVEAPTLTASNQTVEIGGSLNYAPTIGNTRSGEGYTVTVNSVPSNAPAVAWSVSQNRFSIDASSASLGQYTISGNIKDASNNSSTWSFKVTVADSQAPTLTASNQTVEIGGSLNYAPTIGNTRSGEGYTVTVNSVPSNAPAVLWSAGNNRFSIDASSASLGQYTISGSIKDASNNSSTWSFKVTVADSQAPTLTASNQTVEIGGSLNYSPTIGNVRSGEGYTVTVNSVPSNAPAVAWSVSQSRFSIDASSASLGQYTISGSIKDASNNSSTWSFKVTVADSQAPTLTASNQTVEIGGSLNYAPTIGNTRSGEGYTVTVNSVPSNAPAVAWSVSQNRFSIDASSASLGQYTISGSIKDASNNSSTWSFKVTVRDSQAPTLTASNQTVEIGGSLNYSPTIGNTRSGEGYTVTVNSVPSNAPAVLWSAGNNRFSIDASSASLGQYTISGSIKDASNNSSTWSFKVTVADSQAPTLTASNQTVEIGGSLNYSPTIGNTRSGEGYTVTVNSVPSNAPAVAWSVSQSRFSIDASSASLGQYTISGSIKDASNNSSTWSFKVTVADTQAPTLTASNQTVEINRNLTYAPTIGNLRVGEGYTVTVRSITPSRNKPSVTWDSSNKRFSITAGDTTGNWTVSGVIQDASNNSSSWSFSLSVISRANSLVPLLRAQNKTVEIGSHNVIHFPSISQLDSGESYTVAISSLPSGAPTVTWSVSHSRFSIDARSARLGQYRISGTITNSNNRSSSWSFRITVSDTRAPFLGAQNQTVEIGSSLNYAPTIQNLRSNENYTVTINSVPNNAPAVSWSANYSRFLIDARSASLGQYTITGNIKDASNNSRAWSFKVTVEDTQAPTLTVSNQNVEQSETVQYSPTIRNLRQGEAYTVTIGSITPSGNKPTVSWDTTNKRFSITGGDIRGNWTVRGTIQDASNNSSSWSFTVIVTSVAVPALTVSNIAVGVNKKIVHSPSITGVRSNQSFTVTVESVSPSQQAPTVSWDASNRRFSIRSGSKTGVYTVRGKIRKGVNFSSWSFTITVTLNN